jgi:hypothetical protein
MKMVERVVTTIIMIVATVGMLMLATLNAGAESDTVKRCQKAKIIAACDRGTCLANERLEKLNGETANPVKCKAAFDAAVAKADAAAKKGAACRFIDNGDGTISDLNTLLMWEKKDSSSDGVHDKKAKLSWSVAMGGWLSALNGFADCRPSECSPTQKGFAGYTDWRLPTIHRGRDTFPHCRPWGSSADRAMGRRVAEE